MMSRYNQRGLGLLICYVTPEAWGRGGKAHYEKEENEDGALQSADHEDISW